MPVRPTRATGPSLDMLQKLLQRISFGRTSWDPVKYWSQRASDPDTMSVMWANYTFNDLVDRDEWELIERHLPARRDAVLETLHRQGSLEAFTFSVPVRSSLEKTQGERGHTRASPQ